MLDRLIKIISILGTFLIFNGVLYLSIYYQNFGIKIFSYLEFTEVLTAFIDSLQTILTFFVIYILHILITAVLTFKALQKAEKNKPTTIENKHLISKDFLKKINTGLIIQFSIAIVLSILILTGCFKINQWSIYYFSLTVFNLIHFFFDSMEDFFTRLLGKNFYQTLFIAIVLLLPFSVYTIVFAEFNSSRDRQNPKSITITFKDKSVLNSKYIGKTNKYIFLFDKTKNTSMSVALDDVKSIEY